MDPRAPPEGAPGDNLEMASIEKTSDETWSSDNNVPSPLCEQRKKMNNKLLFLTVEYVEDQTRDYARMFSVYEPVSYSPRASSPLSEFEHRVSPHDPNMSSAARYSPTPVQLPPSPFQNSVVVLQNSPSSSSLNSSSETNTRTDINFVTELNDQNTSPSIPQNENTTDFVESNSEEGLVPGNELILIQSGNSELEPSAPPLMLTGSDFALTRDFLVMHDDQISVMNSFKTENLEINETYIPSPIQTLNSNEDIDLCSTVESDKVLNTMKIVDNLLESKDEEMPIKKIVRRSKRQINDKKTYWCTECDAICADEDGCTSHNVQTIADQPVPSRAIATLPSSYLSINKLNSNDVTQQEFGVFAKKIIRKRTQFGPIEGILCAYDGTPFTNVLPLLFENEDGDFFKVDVSNENTSNWMRFVRPALSYKDQNLMICQQNEGIMFLTTRDILPKEELRAGPNPEYAKKRNLKILEADSENANETSSDSWPCFECNRLFPTSGTLQSHLNVHDNPRSESKARSKRRKLHIASNKLFKVVNDQKILYSCPHCSKVFSRSYSLKRHLLIHPNNKTTHYECSKCGENFLYPNNLCRHKKICQNDNETDNKKKGKENSGQNSEWKCTVCNLTFNKESLFDLHKISHNVNSFENGCKFVVCPECGVKFEKQNELIKHVSEHGKLPMKKITNATTSATYKCSMCYKRFATKVRLQQHCLVHGAEDQKPLPCNICFKRFMNNSALSCHLKTHRKEKQMFECPMCKVLFDQILMLKEHVESHRNQDDTFTCPHCQRNFTKYSVIRKHIRAHHCERKHKCTFCVKRFPTVDKLRMHLLRHSDHREFQCAICGKRFKRKDKLKEHVTRMHNSQKPNKEATSPINQVKKFVPKVNPTEYDRFVYKCHQCLVGFKRRGMLVNHLAKRHPDVPPESVPELNLPILRQTRDYYCQYCEKVYKSSSKRKAHIMKNHPGAALPPSNRHKETDIPGLPNSTFSQTVGSVTTTPQGCQWCHKQYASKAKLLQHQRKKHSSLMEPADQVPRHRNRPIHNQNDELILSNINFVMANNVNLMNDEFDSIGQQFVRMRDIR